MTLGRHTNVIIVTFVPYLSLHLKGLKSTPMAFVALLWARRVVIRFWGCVPELLPRQSCGWVPALNYGRTDGHGKSHMTQPSRHQTTKPAKKTASADRLLSQATSFQHVVTATNTLVKFIIKWYVQSDVGRTQFRTVLGRCPFACCGDNFVLLGHI